MPVAAVETCQAFRDVADQVVCAFTPQPFLAVGVWYGDFGQVPDAEVHALLDAAWRAEAQRSA